MGFPAFENCEPTFWGALARLAKRGYVVPPDEARDLMHDFYLEGWNGLVKRYDPQKGQPQKYLSVAFFRFARPRIIRLQNWRGRLRPIRSMLSLTDSAPPPDESLVRAEQINHVRLVLSNLSNQEHQVLEDFVYGASERSVARRHALSRYQSRNILVATLSRIAIELLENSELDEYMGEPFRSASSHLTPGRVVLATWGEGRSAEDVAKLFATSVETVRDAQLTYLRRIKSALHTISYKQRERGPMTAHEQLRAALFAPADDVRLRAVAANAEEIVRALHDDPDQDFTESEAQFLERYPAWTAAVYGALSGSCTEGQNNGLNGRIEQIQEEEEDEIIAVFNQAIRDLPPPLRNWRRVFAGVPDAIPDYQDELRSSRIVEQTDTKGLVRYGVTPITFFEAARGIQLLADRLIAMALGPPDQLPEHDEIRRLCRIVRSQHERRGIVSLGIATDTANPPDALAIISNDLVMGAIRGTIYGPAEVAPTVLRWLVEVARLRPFLFAGYCVRPINERIIELRQEARANRDLLWRWCREQLTALEIEAEAEAVRVR